MYLDFAISTHKNETLLAKGLELEHDYMQVKLQWLVWGCIIFVAAGIITVLFMFIGQDTGEHVARPVMQQLHQDLNVHFAKTFEN